MQIVPVGLLEHAAQGSQHPVLGQVQRGHQGAPEELSLIEGEHQQDDWAAAVENTFDNSVSFKKVYVVIEHQGQCDNNKGYDCGKRKWVEHREIRTV